MRRLFPRQHVISLLLQPISPERCIARFQFATDGELAGEGPYEPFLFEPSQLKVETVAEPEPPDVTPAATAPAAPPSAHLAPQPTESPRHVISPLHPPV